MQDLSIRKTSDLTPAAKEVLEGLLGRSLLDDEVSDEVRHGPR